MKLACLVAFIVSASYSIAQSPNSGNRLQDSYNEMSQHFTFPAPLECDWIEGRGLQFIGEQERLADNDRVLIALANGTLVGSFNTKDSTFLLAENEQGAITSDPASFFVLPVWAIHPGMAADGKDMTVLNLFNTFFEEVLQPNELAVKQETIDAFARYRTDTTLENRRLVYLLDSYQTLVSQLSQTNAYYPTDMTLGIMGQMASECLRLYDQIPVLVCIYMGETLMSAGMDDKAREHFDMVASFYPDAIPVKVYQCQLMLDEKEKAKRVKQLKRFYSSHWMVKGL